MQTIQTLLNSIDEFLWGPWMLLLLVGTGIFLTIRLKFLPWRNLFSSLKSLFSKESMVKKSGGSGDVTPFAALMTALAATIGTGNIVGVATAMVAGGPGALVWMWISAAFGISTKFAECALSIKHRVVNSKGEMLGGPMYSIKAAFNNKLPGKILACLFAIFTMLASFGIGNLTQANSISDAINTTLSVPTWITGIAIAALTLSIVLGGIKVISKVSSVLVPFMAILYLIGGLIIVFGNIQGIPNGIKNIFIMAFCPQSVAGGLAGTVTVTAINAMRFGIGRGVFSNESGMGSAAITAAASQTESHIKQGYINMCGTFLDTIVMCTVTGLAIAASGVLGTVTPKCEGTYTLDGNNLAVLSQNIDRTNDKSKVVYTFTLTDDGFSITDENNNISEYSPCKEEKISTGMQTALDEKLKNTQALLSDNFIEGTWESLDGTHMKFTNDGKFEMLTPTTGAKLTIEAFRSVLGDIGAYIVTIGLILFAFSTILGWEYIGEKALEFLVNKPKLNYIYRLFFSLIVFVGATVALDIVWSFSDIANALMIIPNVTALILLSSNLAKDTKKFHSEMKKYKLKK